MDPAYGYRDSAFPSGNGTPAPRGSGSGFIKPFEFHPHRRLIWTAITLGIILGVGAVEVLIWFLTRDCSLNGRLLAMLGGLVFCLMIGLGSSSV